LPLNIIILSRMLMIN